MTPLQTAVRGISAALQRAGGHPVTPWWTDVWTRFYASPFALLVACVGRGGDKTRESVISGIAETLGGEFDIPLGERHYYVHVAENRDEAAKTLALYEQYLRVLSVGYDRSGDTIELRDLTRGIRVLACRVGAVSGYRCLGWTADEAAKWDNDGVNPSAEVIASLRAMTVTHPNARGRIISSPLGLLGAFHEAWSAGTTESQLAVHAPSWVANHSITEAQTKKLEPNERIWRREYAAEPQGDVTSIFRVEDIDRAMQLCEAA